MHEPQTKYHYRPRARSYKVKRREAVLARLAEIGLTIPTDLPGCYLELPWWEQARYHDFYCNRCKLPLLPDDCPQMGWCSRCWDNRLPVNDGDPTAERISTRGMRRHREAINMERAQRMQADPEVVARAIEAARTGPSVVAAIMSVQRGERPATVEQPPTVPPTAAPQKPDEPLSVMDMLRRSTNNT